jgi:hypothetical protein
MIIYSCIIFGFFAFYVCAGLLNLGDLLLLLPVFGHLWGWW